MHIEVFMGAGSTPNNEQWFWRFRSKGRVTADAEMFPSKANAVRAAKAVVKGVCKRMLTRAPVFWKDQDGGTTLIYWN